MSDLTADVTVRVRESDCRQVMPAILSDLSTNALALGDIATLLTKIWQWYILEMSRSAATLTAGVLPGPCGPA